ncbi:MAG TPA: hypothetical protein VG248_09995 [Caulobacteraceae bacterium]|jgi:antitoxin (DNA-binding transcriptional repressor) of toxin-antitoxin stability system|nr:hypothetical protein [Caulobacteraceae bacterium]
MTRIDLDDLPPRVARLLAELSAGEELLLVQGGGVVARLMIGAAETTATASDEEVDAEAHMEEVLEHFKTMIEDDF